MQQLDTFRRIIGAASTVGAIASSDKEYQFYTSDDATTYLYAEHCAIEVERWDKPIVRCTFNLRLTPGWRVAAEQDESGIYLVLKRRQIVGGLARATILLTLPQNTTCLLEVTGCTLQRELADNEYRLHPDDSLIVTRNEV